MDPALFVGTPNLGGRDESNKQETLKHPLLRNPSSTPRNASAPTLRSSSALSAATPEYHPTMSLSSNSYASEHGNSHLSLGQVKEIHLHRTSAIGTTGMEHLVLIQIEVLCLLNTFHRNHQRLLDHAADIRARVQVRLRGEKTVILLSERVTLLAEVDLEHRRTRLFVGKRDIDTFLETTTNSRIQLPWLFVRRLTRIPPHW